MMITQQSVRKFIEILCSEIYFELLDVHYHLPVINVKLIYVKIVVKITVHV
jgi:hypothetical protein